MALKFKDLKEEMFIYRINPFNFKIEGNRIQQVTGVYDELLRTEHPNAHQLKHWVKITCYMREQLVHSPNLEDVPTFVMILDGQREFQLANTKIEGHEFLFPIPYAAEEKTLKAFQNGK